MLKRKQIILDTDKDDDILRWLDQQPNQSEAVRSAIRAQMRPQTWRLDDLRRVLREELSRWGAPRGENQTGEMDADVEAGARLDAMF